ncbi:thiamine pyrophosphate-dependent enzyme [Rhodothermus profundi]|uniref:Pyruvate ferredoxin oxidoreductase beta subunit n=1 Tax=Rhodothermus profundi TaxID=633813 RepID=A0A1M6RKJ9_9BACT|nr:thiamine pyrophosphate-dependent enzyme [Rhodothermus profundi]SHK32983.1 pyruvate ferredoxin oxidoreductase beta subunit [Rhodothermus profundi]
MATPRLQPNGKGLRPKTLKELAEREERMLRFQGGHSLCAGCGVPLVVRMVLNTIDTPVIVVNATGCLEVATTRYPATAWNIPWLHVAFENAAAAASGVETAFRVLQRKRQRGHPAPFELPEDVRIIVFGGDGGTYDIGLQALSGALERGHRFTYICYDNEAYMNTGNQRSGATPPLAYTTTTPVGTQSLGKLQQRKDLTEIAVAHHVPYVAQASISHWQDLVRKIQMAVQADGPSFLNVLAPCQRGWGYDPAQTVEIARLAVETCFWPLYEVIDGEYWLNARPSKPRPIAEWIKTQNRFRHLLRPENRHLLDMLQEQVNRAWDRLLRKCEGRLLEV